MKTKFEKLANSEIKVTVEIPEVDLEKYRKDGLKRVQETVQMDGFRKGNVPENLIIQKYGEMIILEEMANLAINETFYLAIIQENEEKKAEEKILPIVQPKIQITKLAKGSPLEYTATFPVVPKVELQDYKKLAQRVNQNIEQESLLELQKQDKETKDEDLLLVRDSEVEQVLEDLRKARLEKVSPEEISTHEHHHDHEHTHDHEHSHEHEPKVTAKSEVAEEVEVEALPPLDDAFAQSFGEQFKTLEDLKKKIKENLVLEKSAKLQERKRTQVLEQLVAETKIDIPESLIENEFQKMKAQTKADVEQYGGKWEEYLTQIKKTEEDLKKEWQSIARKRVASQLIINEIAKLEQVKVEKTEIEAEALKILAQMPGADETQVNNYVEQILSNEKVMKILDSTK